MTAPADVALVGFGMYPFGALRPHYARLWQRVRDELAVTADRDVHGGVPALLQWDNDLHASWRDPALAVSQTCGWPLVTELADLVSAGRIRVVGTFVHTVPEAEGPTYRSVLVARSAEVASLAGGRAAVNAFSSLSGWVSLVHAVHGPGAQWEGTVVETGAHLDSLLAVRDGLADIASIDAVTFAHIRRLMPEVVGGLHVVGHGPRVPCLPVIAGPAAADIPLAVLRRAFARALSGDDAADLREVLLVDGFTVLDAADYRPLLELAPAARAAGHDTGGRDG